ncbi:hypothetical protein [Thalassospira povalilytica]|uniref:hypothetical protein n=1 Tax=Thalassospira povalilytica TaxID=732237 RepID=UPI003AA9BCF2
MSNEAKACNAVIQLLERRAEQDCSHKYYPERENAAAPVEIIFSIGDSTYALEHTLVEPFSKHIHFGQRFSQLVSPISDTISEQLPELGVYTLYFPINTSLGTSREALPQMQHVLSDWVSENAQLLHERLPPCLDRDHFPYGYKETITGTPEGFPYPITLEIKVHWSLSDSHNGILICDRVISESNLSNQRNIPMLRAFCNKRRKLSECHELGYITALIIETNDISLTNYVTVADAVRAATRIKPDWLDKLFLINTSVESIWAMYEWDWHDQFWIHPHHSISPNELSEQL